MNWFQAWCAPQVADIKYNVMGPYTLHIFVGWMRSSKDDGSDSLTTQITNKWKVNANLRDDKHICIYLAKMWATWKGFGDGSKAWEICTNIKIWKDFVIPQQQLNWECGYYVLKCITDICIRKRTMPSDMWKVSYLKFINVFFTYKLCYYI